MLHTASSTQAERLAPRRSRGRGASAATRSAMPATTSSGEGTWKSVVAVINPELPVVLGRARRGLTGHCHLGTTVPVNRGTSSPLRVHMRDQRPRQAREPHFYRGQERRLPLDRGREVVRTPYERWIRN